MRLLLAVIFSFTLTLSTLPASAQTSSVKTNRPQAPRASAAKEPGISLILNECEADQCADGRRGIWIFDGNQGQALWGWGPTASLTITSYAKGVGDADRVIVIDRVSKPNFRAHYEGTVKGNQLTGFIMVNGKTGPWEATIEPELCPTARAWFPVTPRQLSQLGENTYDAGLQVAGFQVFMAAANLGDSDGQAFTAYVLSKSDPTAEEKARAFQLAQDSANQNNPFGMLMLGEMYRTGAGTKADLQMSNQWKDKARAEMAAEKEAAAQQQAQAQLQAGVNQLFIGAFMYGLMHGDLDGDPAPASDSTIRLQRAWQATHVVQH